MMVGCGGHLLSGQHFVPWTGVNARVEQRVYQLAQYARQLRYIELRAWWTSCHHLGPSKGQLAGNRRFSGTDGYGAHDERKRRGCHSPAGLRCRLPQCQLMTSAVHERGPHHRGSSVGCRKRDCRRGSLRSTEHGARMKLSKNRCASPSMVMVLGLRQTAEERRLGRLMKHEQCAQQTNDNESRRGGEAKGGKALAAKGLGTWLGTWPGYLVWAPRCSVPRYRVRVPGHLVQESGCMHCAGMVAVLLCCCAIV